VCASVVGWVLMWLLQVIEERHAQLKEKSE
jgi:hypothetical protein